MLEALAATDLAQAMRTGRWLYAGVSAGHILGLALLVGAILPYDLALLGAWPGALATLARVAVPVAATGLALAVATGALLVLARPADYAAQPLFLAKLALVGCGAAHALVWRRRLATASRRRQRLAGALSALVWLSALAAGRLLAFTD